MEYKKENIKDAKGNELGYLLKEIPDFPKKMRYVGDISLLADKDTKFLCVVGSRKYTSYGYDATVRLISSLKGQNVVIVSGMALGIDGIAHRTALDVGLKCIGVGGAGLDPNVFYPRSHVPLAEEIVAKGGLLLSEYDDTFHASPWSFPVRNRILAGLSHAVFVIEAENDSGTLITARLGLEYNREILALAGSIFSSASEGPLALIRRGATCITKAEDLHEALGLSLPTYDLQAVEDREEGMRRCSAEEKQIIDMLEQREIGLSRSQLEEQAGEMDISKGKVAIILSMLEIRGLIREELGLIKLTI